MVEFNIKKLRSGGLITNYFCTSSCKHCLYNCSPQWEKRYIDPVTAEKNLKAVHSLGCRSVHIGGGEPLLGHKTFSQIIQESTGNCSRELSDTSHFHIDLFGNYIPGLCSGLSISIEDLGKPLSAEIYPILACLYRDGIRGLIKLAGDITGFNPRRGLYINKCDLCTEVRSFLAQNDYQGSNELSPVEFYTQKMGNFNV